MRSEVWTADGNGEFIFGPGVGLVAVPDGDGAQYPLTLKRNGVEGDVLIIDDDRPYYTGHFGWMRAGGTLNAQAGARWRIVLLEDKAEMVGPASGAYAKPVRLFHYELSGTIENGTVFPSHLGPDDGTEYLYDVSRFRQVSLVMRGSAVAAHATEQLSAFLCVWTDRHPSGTTGPYPGVEAIPCGVANNFVSAAAAGAAGFIHIGEGLYENGGPLWFVRGQRYNYVSVRLEASNGPIVPTGTVVVELWGYP